MVDKISFSYEKVRTHSITICEPLFIEDFNSQSASFVSPPKWHLAHTTWFFEQMILVPFVKSYKVYDQDYSFLFNSYYNSVGRRLERGKRGLLTRPSVAEVLEYRDYVDLAMQSLLKMDDLSSEIRELVILGLNHEQQHQELLLTDLKYTFYQNPLFPAYHKNEIEHYKTTDSDEVRISSGLYEIGASGDSFCFDNELGRHKVYLDEFIVSGSLITNGEFISFLEAGGYETPSLWLDDGWSWVMTNNISKPLYWHEKEGEWYHFTLSGLVKIDLNAAFCHASFYEANAFASFKKMRLLTEFEWEVASKEINWGTRWEWTYSAYLPYPRFTLKEGAVGEYNGKFMINQMVLRGGSVVTSQGHSRNTYRNFFTPDTRWQFSGIRLAK